VVTGGDKSTVPSISRKQRPAGDKRIVLLDREPTLEIGGFADDCFLRHRREDNFALSDHDERKAIMDGPPNRARMDAVCGSKFFDGKCNA
jgi:hypothetical protein